MKKKIIFIFILILFNFFPVQKKFSHQIIYDTVICNGEVYDGFSEYPRELNIGIIKDKIAYIGKNNIKGKKYINADGKIVSPGFIDTQSHSDHTMPLKNRNYAMYYAQGITTTVIGNCGQSPVDIDAFSNSIDNAGLNYAIYTGYNSLKMNVQGKNSDRKANKKEFERIVKLLRKNLENGSIGMSLGLAYYPAYNFNSTEEIIKLINEVKDLKPLLSAHIRNESHNIEESIKEVIDISSETGIPLIISHLKVIGKQNEGISSKILALINHYKNKGLKIHYNT
ncbi:MAG: amidohydrolase family protein, partial [Spirochaetota bacterium]